MGLILKVIVKIFTAIKIFTFFLIACVLSKNTPYELLFLCYTREPREINAFLAN